MESIGWCRKQARGHRWFAVATAVAFAMASTVPVYAEPKGEATGGVKGGFGGTLGGVLGGLTNALGTILNNQALTYAQSLEDKLAAGGDVTPREWELLSKLMSDATGHPVSVSMTGPGYDELSFGVGFKAEKTVAKFQAFLEQAIAETKGLSVSWRDDPPPTEGANGDGPPRHYWYRCTDSDCTGHITETEDGNEVCKEHCEFEFPLWAWGIIKIAVWIVPIVVVPIAGIMWGIEVATHDETVIDS